MLRDGLKGLIADGPTPVGIVWHTQTEGEGQRVSSSAGDILAALP